MYHWSFSKRNSCEIVCFKVSFRLFAVIEKGESQKFNEALIDYSFARRSK